MTCIWRMWFIFNVFPQSIEIIAGVFSKLGASGDNVLSNCLNQLRASLFFYSGLLIKISSHVTRYWGKLEFHEKKIGRLTDRHLDCILLLLHWLNFRNSFKMFAAAHFWQWKSRQLFRSSEVCYSSLFWPHSSGRVSPIRASSHEPRRMRRQT